MEFKIDLLTKNIDITDIDKLILYSDIIEVNPIMRIKVSDKYVPVNHSAKYSVVFNNRDFEIQIKRLTGGLLKISLICEYKKDKFTSAKKFEIFYSEFRSFLDKNKIHYSVLKNDVSEYFAQRLYPKFQKYESVLRQIFILALSPLEDENIVQQVKKETKGKLDLSQVRTIEKIEKLQIAELHFLIFDLNLNTNLNSVDELNTYFKNFEIKSENQLKDMIKSVLPFTIWERHFKKFLPNSKDALEDYYNQIRTYRNSVMHFHTIRFRQYQKIDNLISKAIDELETLEENMLIEWDFESTRNLINDMVRGELFGNLSNMSKMISSAMKPALDNISTININLNKAMEPMAELFQKIQMPKIDTSALDILSTSLSKISSQINEIKSFSNLMPELPQITPSPILNISSNLPKITLPSILNSLDFDYGYSDGDSDNDNENKS